MGKEFIRYRKNNPKNVRKYFANKMIGTNEIPVVIDSVDLELSKALAGKNNRYNGNGMEANFHKTLNISDILRHIKMKLGPEFVNFNYKLGLENGIILKPIDIIEEIYDKYHDQQD